MQRRGSASGSGTFMNVGAALAIAVGLAYWYVNRENSDTLSDSSALSSGEQASPEQFAEPPPVAGLEQTLLLHGVILLPTPSAQISMEGVPQRNFAVGDTIAEGYRVAAIELNRVTVDVNGRQLVLTIDPRSGRPGDRVGLDPEPVTMPQLSGAEIERRQAAAMAELMAEQAQPTPEALGSSQP